MKEKIKHILIGVLIGFIALPVITFGGSFVSSLIQGKTVEEAIQILAEQIDNVLVRIGVVETKQAEQEQAIEKLKKQILCQELIKQTPQMGESSYKNVDIVKFYQKNKLILSEKEALLSYLKTLPVFTEQLKDVHDKPYYLSHPNESLVRDPKTNIVYSLENLENDVKFFQKVVSDAQLLYDKYIATCGD